MKSFEIQISSGFYISAAFAVLLLPWNLLLAFILAASVHELCHLVVLKWYRVPVHQIKLGLLGAKITTGPLLPWQELICAAAGPFGSLALVLLSRWAPLLALFGLVQGVFNLLPVYPMDGGRIFRSIFMLAKMARWDYNSPDYEK